MRLTQAFAAALLGAATVSALAIDSNLLKRDTEALDEPAGPPIGGLLSTIAKDAPKLTKGVPKIEEDLKKGEGEIKKLGGDIKKKPQEPKKSDTPHKDPEKVDEPHKEPKKADEPKGAKKGDIPQKDPKESEESRKHHEKGDGPHKKPMHGEEPHTEPHKEPMHGEQPQREPHKEPMHGEQPHREPHKESMHGEEPHREPKHGDEPHNKPMHGEEPHNESKHGDEPHKESKHGDDHSAVWGPNEHTDRGPKKKHPEHEGPSSTKLGEHPRKPDDHNDHNDPGGRRSDKAFHDISADKHHWDQFKQGCTSKILSRRRVDGKPAGHDEVGLGQYKESINALWTQGLRTCMGIVITGSSEGKKDHFLMHMSGDALDKDFEAFEQAVKKAKLSKTRAYISAPDLHAPGWENKERTGLKTLVEEVAHLLSRKVANLVNGEVMVVDHDVLSVDTKGDPHGTMSVSSDGEIFVEGRKM